MFADLPFVTAPDRVKSRFKSGNRPRGFGGFHIDGNTVNRDLSACISKQTIVKLLVQSSCASGRTLPDIC
jgi:hypothetical protein